MYECMGTWVYGCMSVWVHGCMSVWVYECMGTWVYEYMGVWVHGCTYAKTKISIIKSSKLNIFTIHSTTQYKVYI